MTTSRFACRILLSAALGLATAPLFAQVKVDERLPEYKTVSGVSGNVKSVGSDTLNNLMALWSESFRAIYPNVTFQVEGKGSSTAQSLDCRSSLRKRGRWGSFPCARRARCSILSSWRV